MEARSLSAVVSGVVGREVAREDVALRLLGCGVAVTPGGDGIAPVALEDVSDDHVVGPGSTGHINGWARHPEFKITLGMGVARPGEGHDHRQRSRLRTSRLITMDCKHHSAWNKEGSVLWKVHITRRRVRACGHGAENRGESGLSPPLFPLFFPP